MIKYLKELGYKYTENNDLTNKQFHFLDSDIDVDPDLTVMGKIRYITTNTFELFLKEDAFNTIEFKRQMVKLQNTLYNTALTSSEITVPSEKVTPETGEVFFLHDVNTNIERQENGYFITLTFILKGD